MTKDIVYTLLTVPLILLVSLAVFQQFFANTRQSFEAQIVGEELGVLDTSPKTFVTKYPAKVGSASVYAKNTTSGAAVSITVNSIDYKDGLEPAAIQVSSSTVGSDIKVYADYTAYSKEGYSSFVRTYRGGQTGFNLASLVPFILIALVVVAIIIEVLR